MTENKNEMVVKKGLFKPSTIEQTRSAFYRFTRNKFSIVGLVMVLITIFFAVFAEQIVPYPADVGAKTNFAEARMAPCAEHIFGTDNVGRDVFTRVIFSFRGALRLGIVVLAISVPLGVGLGLLAGYFRGTWVDAVIMRITDVFLSIPPMILALAIASILKPTMMNSMLALTAVWWTWYTRIVYGIATTVSQEYFVKEAELIGASTAHIVFKEVLPSALSSVMTRMALDIGWVILTGASLSFAGLGEQPPAPAFGTMINNAVDFLPEQWWLTVFPAIGIAFVILGFNFLGDGIRDMLDRGRQ